MSDAPFQIGTMPLKPLDLNLNERRQETRVVGLNTVERRLADADRRHAERRQYAAKPSGWGAL